MDHNINKLISVHICTYNRADLIGVALQSVLDQTYQNLEILVIDDASADNTEEVVKNFDDPRIKYFKNEKNVGIARNRNIALEKSSGDYVAILDSDDFWNDNEKLERQIKFLEENKNVKVVGTWAKKVDLENNIVGDIKNEPNDLDIRKKILLENQFVNSSVLISTKVMKETGGYNPELKVAEDYDLFLKIGKKYKLANLSELMTSYRVANQSYTNNKQLVYRHHIDLIKKYKDDYPNYQQALIVMNLKLALSRLFRL